MSFVFALKTVSRIVFVFGHEPDDLVSSWRCLANDPWNEIDELSNLKFMHAGFPSIGVPTPFI